MYERKYHVYLLTNKIHTVLYTGVTNYLIARHYQHKMKKGSLFTAKYNVNKLVYYEEFRDISFAIAREKEIKGWIRAKKIALINSMNPEWKDLSEDF